jgi:GxxExxY protein
LPTPLSARHAKCTAFCFVRQVPVAVTYKNVAIGEARLDLFVSDRLVVELKACQQLLPLHLAQVLSYLKASDRSLGLLIDFNVISFATALDA